MLTLVLLCYVAHLASLDFPTPGQRQQMMPTEHLLCAGIVLGTSPTFTYLTLTATR